MLTIRDDDYVNLNYFSDLIEDCVAPIHRSRLHFLLSKPNRREEVERAFRADSVFDERFLIRIEPNENSADAIYRRMKKWGARPKCFAFGSRSLDKGEFELKFALESHVGYGFGSEVVLYCRESKAAYWRGHDGNDDHWLLHRPS